MRRDHVGHVLGMNVVLIDGGKHGPLIRIRSVPFSPVSLERRIGMPAGLTSAGSIANFNN